MIDYQYDNADRLTRVKHRQLRGNGRTRRMVRERDVVPDSFSAHPPLANTTVWTDYAGVIPSDDYTVTSCPSSPTVVDQTHYDLGLAEIDFTAGDAVAYTHTNHLGTTRARTDDPPPPGSSGGAPSVFTRPVYTAFGERVAPDGTIGCLPGGGGSCSAIGTRYGYVGKEGYETFEPGDVSPYYWGEYDPDGPGGTPATPAPFGFIHTGARWYDPATGRFLQRDPMGIYAAENVYVYGNSRPTSNVDPTGLIDLGGGGASHIYPVPGLSHQQQLLGEENPGLLIGGGIVVGGGLLLLAAPEGAIPAAIAGAKNLLTRGLRWLNTGKLRFGMSCHDSNVYVSLRWKNNHLVDVPMPKWLKDLY